MIRSLKFLGLSLALALGGCGAYSLDYGPGPASVSGALTVSNGLQSGAMGEIRGFDGSASEHSGYYDSYGSNLRIDSIGSGWWVMSSINVTGDLAGPAFAPGTHRTYTSGTWDAENNVSVTGCSGPSYGSYTFDGPADQVTIDVEELPDGSRRMNFETNYGGNITTGSVDYRIDGTSGTTAPGTDRGI
jgi:hypothetical protein